MARIIKPLLSVIILMVVGSIGWIQGAIDGAMTGISIQLLLFGAMTVLLVMFFDISRLNWITFFYMSIGGAAVVATAIGRTSAVHFFTAAQFALLSIALAQTELSVKKRTVLSLVSGMILAAMLTMSLQWVSQTNSLVLFVWISLVLSLVPIFFESRLHQFSEQLWIAVSAQQTVLRYTLIFFVYAKISGIVPEEQVVFRSYTIHSIVLFSAVLLYGIVFIKPGSWDRICQSLLTILILGQTFYQNSQAQVPLLLLTTLLSVCSADTLRDVRHTSQFQGIVRALENGGYGGGVFFVTMILIHVNCVRENFEETVVWTVLTFILGCVSWVRSVDYSAPNVQNLNSRRVTAKLVLQGVFTSVVLSWYILQFFNLKGLGSLRV